MDIFQAVGFFRVESCSTEAVLPLVGLAADQIIRARYILWFALTGVATVAIMLIGGYVAARRQRRRAAERLLELTSRLDQASTLIARVESISERLRCAMATHHSTLAQCHDEIQVLSDKHSGGSDTGHHMHLQEALQPAARLSEDIVHAYDELRQRTSELRHLRNPDSRPWRSREGHSGDGMEAKAHKD